MEKEHETKKKKNTFTQEEFYILAKTIVRYI